MSGPKDSSYTISASEYRRQEAERKRRLEEERRRIEEERRRIEEERRRQEELKCQELEKAIAKTRKQLEGEKTAFEQSAGEKLAEARQAFQESRGICVLEDTLKTMQRKFESLTALPVVRNSSKLSDLLKAMGSLIEEIQKSQNEPLNMIQAELVQHGISVAEKSFLGKKFVRADKKSISLKPIQRAMPQKDTTNDASALMKAITLFQSAIAPYLDGLPARERSELESLAVSVTRIAQDASLDTAFKARQIEARRKTFEATKGAYDAAVHQLQQVSCECEQLHTDYAAVCRLLGEEAEPFVFDAANAALQREQLGRMIKSQNTRLEQKETAEYISRSVNEVMEELGYDIIATDFMRMPKRNVIHNIYDFEQGSAISVYTSDNGSLMLEVTGVHEGEDASELAEHEKLELKERMGSFCDKYPQIRERLQAKGIQLANENCRPPDVSYAKTIDLGRKKKIATGKSKRAGAAHLHRGKAHRMDS